MEEVLEKVALEPEETLSVQELVDEACVLFEMDLPSLSTPGKARKASKIRAILAFLVRESKVMTLAGAPSIIYSFITYKQSGV